jgi:hypothetical protein
MKVNQNGPDPDREFVERVLHYQEKELTRDELAQLNDDLRDNPALRAEFIRICGMSRLIRETQALPQRRELGHRRFAPLASFKWRWVEHAGIAALLLLCLGLVYPLWKNLHAGHEGITDPSPASSGEAGAVATLIHADRDVVFAPNHDLPRTVGEALPKGWVRLQHGTIEVAFRSGAIVHILGPALFGLDSPMRAFLEYGRVEVHAPDEARDFVIGTPAMDVVDLGTRFEMAVDQDSSEVLVDVIEGLVDLHLGGEGIAQRIQPLPAGQSARVDASGQILELVGNALDPALQSASGLVAHWTLDRVGSDGKIEDASGNRLHGSMQHKTAGTTLPGKVGKALNLGPDEYVDLSRHIPTLAGSAAFTFTCWICDARDMMFSVSDGTRLDRLQFELLGKSLLYGWQQGGQFDHVQARVPEWKRGRWYHVAVAMSGRAVTMYRDGRALVTRSAGIKLNSASVALSDLNKPTHAYIGHLISNHANQKQFLFGKIDDVQFYNRALDEQAVRYLFEHPGATWDAAVTGGLAQHAASTD